MAIDENDPRLKDMLRAIELGETLEDLDDPEDYEDQGGINSLKRKPPSIKMASEPEDEFELELGTVIKEYNDLKEQGIIKDISIEEYIDKYLSKKKKSPNMQMAGMGNVMKLFETPYGFDRDSFEDNYIQFLDYKEGGGNLGLHDFTINALGMVQKQTPSAPMKMADGGMMSVLPQGMEMDYREGGMIPMGSKERADDVPARVSKNEFVMTADAVRAAGGGSVNKGAQRMYQLMNNLEARA